MELRFLVSFLKLFNLRLKAVSVFTTYCILHNLHSIRQITYSVLKLRLKKMLNVGFVCWFMMNMFAVITWLQHRVLVSIKHGVYFPVLEGILNFFLTLPFLTCVPPIISFRLLFPLTAVIGCSWIDSWRFLLVWRMFQFLQTTTVRFSKNWLYVLDIVVPDPFLVVDCLWQAYQLFLIADQQVFGRKLASKISFGFLEWWPKPFLIEQILFTQGVWLYGMLLFNNFKSFVFFLNILTCNLMLLMFTSVSRNEILSFDI